jgi:hypothetical protein
MRLLMHFLATAMLVPLTTAAANPPARLEFRRKALNDLLHEQWEYTMRTSPYNQQSCGSSFACFCWRLCY